MGGMVVQSGSITFEFPQFSQEFFGIGALHCDALHTEFEHLSAGQSAGSVGLSILQRSGQSKHSFPVSEAVLRPHDEVSASGPKEPLHASGQFALSQ